MCVLSLLRFVGRCCDERTLIVDVILKVFCNSLTASFISMFVDIDVILIKTLTVFFYYSKDDEWVYQKYLKMAHTFCNIEQHMKL